MHRIARRGGSEMGEAGAGQMDMGRIVRVDRGKQAAFRIGSRNIDTLAEPAFFDNLGYACFRIDRRMREFQNGTRALDMPEFFTDTCGDLPLSIGIRQLDQIQGFPPDISDVVAWL
jgi:hypothetical protein